MGHHVTAVVMTLLLTATMVLRMLSSLVKVRNLLARFTGHASVGLHGQALPAKLAALLLKFPWALK